jgi:hypothetical protein
VKSAVLLVLAACVSACGGPAPPARELDAAAESYVRLVLALAERDADSLDIYYGPSAWEQDARARRPSLDDTRSAAAALLKSLEAKLFYDAEAEGRRTFLIRQLRAVVTRIDIVRGARPPFAEEARALFGLEGQDGRDRQERQDGREGRDRRAGRDRQDGQEGRERAVRAELERLLPGGGDLTKRYAAFDRRFLIAPDRLPAVFARAVEGCRAVTRAHLTLPPDERIDIEYAPVLAWSAFTRYEGVFKSRISINTGLPLTVDRALDLACHESYPGHHAIDSLVDARFSGRRIELSVRPLFSPQSLLHEAAASIASELAFPGAARLAFERDQLFRAADLDPADADRYLRVARLVDRLHGVQADIARRYLDGELDFARASAALAREALMPSADATLKFLNQFRSYAVTYTAGRDALSRHLDAHSTAGDDGASRWRAYINVVTDPSQVVPSEAPRK